VIAAAVNAAPELFLGIILDRPFLDPLLALENERSPLTTTNYFEFGDPHSREGYQSILAWSPYDQVRAQAYPNTWLKGFEHDQRTKATGLIKWAARVRQLATNRPEILIDLAEDGGHYGSYNATERRRSDAAMLAFAFELLGFDDTTLPSLNRM
jgi:oligopeptidase B